MVDSFAALKKRSKTDLDDLTKNMDALDSRSTNPEDDGTFWKITTDKAGNGYAVIRFLPAPKDHDSPFVRGWDHGFQGPNGWYIEESLTTIGLDDPVSDYNSKLWDSGQKDQARKQKRRLKYYANILVISDPKNPEAEGKVFRFRFGKSIFDMIKEAANPDEIAREVEGKEPFNPFDFWNGANFKIRCHVEDNFRKYSKSEFEEPSELFGGDEDQLKELWDQEHELFSFVDPENEKRFKPYEELEKKLRRVLGLTSKDTENGKSSNDDIRKEEKSKFDQEPEEPGPDLSGEPEDTGGDDGGDDDIAFFQSLVND